MAHPGLPLEGPLASVVQASVDPCWAGEVVLLHATFCFATFARDLVSFPDCVSFWQVWVWYVCACLLQIATSEFDDDVLVS